MLIKFCKIKVCGILDFLTVFFLLWSFLLFFFHVFLYILFWCNFREFILEIEFFFRGFCFYNHIVIDLFSLIFLRFIFLISMVVIFYRWFYIRTDLNLVRFLVLVIFFIRSMGLLTLSPSIVGLILGWDGLGVTSFLLVIYYNNVSSLRSGLITIFTNRFGDVFLLFGLFYLLSFGWYIGDVFFLYFIPVFFSLFFLLAGITKRAQIPFSAWLPAAMSAPTPVSSLVHSSTLVTAGVYLFIRYYFIINNLLLSFLFTILRLLTRLTAGVIACVERDLKKLVAISTLRQLGIIIFCVCISQVFFTFFHIVRHALFKSLLFLCCGFFILIRLGNQDIRFIGNKYILRKGFFFILLLSVLRLCGFPFLSGFFSKDLIIDFIFNESIITIFLWLFLFSCLLSLIYRFKFLNLGLIKGQLRFFSCSTFFNFFLTMILIVLFIWSIFLGRNVFFLIIDGELFIFFYIYKVIGLLLYFFTFFIFLNIFLQLVFHKSLISFFREILNINWYFRSKITNNLFFTYIFIVGEIFWLEVYGAKGLRMVLSFLNSFFSLFIKNSTTSLLFFIIIFFSFFIFLSYSL